MDPLGRQFSTMPSHPECEMSGETENALEALESTTGRSYHSVFSAMRTTLVVLGISRSRQPCHCHIDKSTWSPHMCCIKHLLPFHRVLAFHRTKYEKELRLRR